MKNILSGLFLFCSFLAHGQRGPMASPLNCSGIKLISGEHTVLDGQIISSGSFDVVAYADYHMRLSNCLSPYVILSEPLAHNLLMSHMHVHFVSSNSSQTDGFSANSAAYGSYDDYSDLEQQHYSSLYSGSSSSPPASGSSRKLSPIAFLAILAYQVATADHNWGGYPAQK
jgi:hypothetical protein